MSTPVEPRAGVASPAERVNGLDWSAIGAGLDEVGIAVTGPVLTGQECAGLRLSFDDDARFRSTVDMARHRFGAGVYRYFDYPLPDLVDSLREGLWPHLLPVARQWAQRRGQSDRWPDTLAEWLENCAAAGQLRPTPLMLRYGPGDWNALHRDLYGDLVFPLQVVFGLDEPNVDYTGGEFVVVEQRPRAQSRATTTVIPKGHGLVLTTRDRPIRSSRGWSSAPIRHGVSTVRSGRRHTLGIIFHDAT